VREDHAAYIAGWLETLRDDKRLIFSAAAHVRVSPITCLLVNAAARLVVNCTWASQAPKGLLRRSTSANVGPPRKPAYSLTRKRREDVSDLVGLRAGDPAFSRGKCGPSPVLLSNGLLAS
jgi:hypothetical protein